MLISADVCAFRLFFVHFSECGLHDAALYKQSRRALDANIGLLNRRILLASS